MQIIVYFLYFTHFLQLKPSSTAATRDRLTNGERDEWIWQLPWCSVRSSHWITSIGLWFFFKLGRRMTAGSKRRDKQGLGPSKYQLFVLILYFTLQVMRFEELWPVRGGVK